MSLKSISRDRAQRRQHLKLLTNVVLIVLVSTAAAYVITKPVGGTGFNPSAAVLRALRAHGGDQAGAAGKPNGSPVANGDSIAAASGSPNYTSGYKLQPGPFKVAEVGDIVLHDARRNKDVHMRIFYPEGAGQFPVIVFSHGAGGSQNCCEELTQHWASYGYVTIQPTHDDSATQRRNAGEENVRFMQAVRDALKQPALWESRPQDISFVLDSLGELQKRVAGLSGKIDERHVGVGGHSMGSFTAEAVAGATVDLLGKVATSFADPRVKAALALSPQGPGQFGLTQTSFQSLRIPFLGVTGSQDSLGPLANVAWHEKPYDLSPAGDKYFLNIAGANHMSFITARAASFGRGQQAPEILDYTNSAALAFWDAYLKHDSSGREYLRSENMQTFSKGAAKLESR
jgi:predicted dienelactone hydrolase